MLKHHSTKVHKNGGSAPITTDPGIQVSGQLHDLAVLHLVVRAKIIKYKMIKKPQGFPSQQVYEVKGNMLGQCHEVSPSTTLQAVTFMCPSEQDVSH